MVEIRLQNGESREFPYVEIGDDGIVFAYQRTGEYPENRYPLQSVFPPGSVLEINIDEGGSHSSESGQILGTQEYEFEDPNPGKD